MDVSSIVNLFHYNDKILRLSLLLSIQVLVSTSCSPGAKDVLHGHTARGAEHYSITYYDVDAAEDKSAVEETIATTDKTAEIERVLTSLRVSKSLIEQYAVVFSRDRMLLNSASHDQATMIVRNGRQIAVPHVPEGATGFFDDEAKIIWLNSIYSATDVRWIFTHELGHAVRQRLSPEEFYEFMRLRNVPSVIADSWQRCLSEERRREDALRSANPPLTPMPALEKPLYQDVWKLNPCEDFAEVFRVLYKPPYITEPWEVTTYYGKPDDAIRGWFDYTVRPKFQD